MKLKMTVLAAGLLASAALLSAASAGADVGVEKVTPPAGAPGDTVRLTLGCGFCYPPCHGAPGHRKPSPCMLGTKARPPAAFPISLVPIEKTPEPYRCGPNALCSPQTVGPPRRRPFTFLGRATPAPDGGPRRSGKHHVPRYLLRFPVPDLRPGLYAFVIYCGSCLPGKPGSLIAAPSWRLRIQPASGWGGGALRSQ